ncbi:hypothetical protein CBL_09654 [Carabus blaptoides fortunei]
MRTISCWRIATSSAKRDIVIAELPMSGCITGAGYRLTLAPTNHERCMSNRVYYWCWLGWTVGNVVRSMSQKDAYFGTVIHTQVPHCIPLHSSLTCSDQKRVPKLSTHKCLASKHQTCTHHQQYHNHDREAVTWPGVPRGRKKTPTVTVLAIEKRVGMTRDLS